MSRVLVIGRKLKLALIVFFLVLIVIPLHSASPKASLHLIVDPKEIGSSEQLHLILEVSSDQEEEVVFPSREELMQGPFSAFNFGKEWSESSARSQIVQGKNGVQIESIYSQTTHFILTPKKVGVAQIGPIPVLIGGKKFQTEASNVRVAAGNVTHPRNQPRQNQPVPPSEDDSDEDLFSLLLRRQGLPMPPGFGGGNPGQAPDSGFTGQPFNPKEAFFVQVEVDRKVAYVGEQVTASWYLYTRGQIRDLDTLKYPNLRGFWKEDIEIATHLNFVQDVIKGVPYKKALLASFALFPIKEGISTIDPYTAKCSVVAFDDPFGAFSGKAYTYTKSSSPVKIEVKPIPAEGRPSDFSGAVGEYQVLAKVDEPRVQANQPFPLKIRFEGRGNAKLIELPPFQPPTGMEIYDTQKESKFFRNGTSYKEFTLLLIARHPGQYTIPAVSSSIFDPSQKAFVQIKTDPIQIVVAPGNPSSPDALSLPPEKASSDNAEQKRIDLIFSPQPEMHGSSALNQWQWPLLLGINFLCLIGLAYLAQKKIGIIGSKKSLEQKIQLRFNRIIQESEKADIRNVGKDSINAIYWALGEISGQGGAAMELEKLLQSVPPSIRQELGTEISVAMEKFQAMAFAPAGSHSGITPAEVSKLLEKQKALLLKTAKLLVSVLPFIVFSQIAFSKPSVATVPVPQILNLNFDDFVPSERWIYGLGNKPKSNIASVNSLLEAKKAEIEAKWSECPILAQRARSSARSLVAWIDLYELRCAMQALQKGGRQYNSLFHALENLDHHPEQMLIGPASAPLKQLYIEGALQLFDLETHSDRSLAWLAFDRLDKIKNWLDEKQRAKVYRDAAELSFVQQHIEIARAFYHHSLELQPDQPEVQQKLKTLEQTLIKPLDNDQSAISSGTLAKNVDAKLEAGPQESDLVNRATADLARGDLATAADELLEITREFPGGARAKWATDRMLEAYLSVAEQESENKVRTQILAEMLQAEVDRRVDWAKVLCTKEFFDDCYRLSKSAADSSKGIAREAKALTLSMAAALATEKWSDLRDAAQALMDRHAGTPISREAMLRAAQAAFHQKDYAASIAYLERLVSLPQADSQELIARYWLWRSLQKTNSPRSDEQRDYLMNRFPLSYYGLRARMERDGVLTGPWTTAVGGDTQTNSLRLEEVFTAENRAGFERAQLLLKAGWLEEAALELRDLPKPSTAKGRILRAKMQAAALDYSPAIKYLSDVWDQNVSLRRESILRIAFPYEFLPFVERESKSRNIEKWLMMGLMRQESAFNVKAQSPSPAYGLTQIIAPTSREIADDLKMGVLDPKQDLFKPSLSIQMGTYYLNKLIKKYQGHIPLALAAYNAGPGRMDKWLKTRPSLKDLAQTKSSEVDNELWFDELPWSETSLYVKAILRNLLIYRVLDKGRWEISDPYWLEKPANLNPGI